MDYDKCLSRLQRLCSKAEYCHSQMYSKALKDLEGDSSAAARIVASLKADKYVDDARYAACFAREKSSLQGWGAIKIRFQLRAKGVSDDDIAAGLAEIEPAKAEARLEKLVAEKYKLLAGDPQCKLKLLKYSLSRGYSYEEVAGVIDAIMSGREM
ncbi:MAG: RecX family transcriptional regulator [Bacteroidales bacterium]|nr:RecX family transcriptional regulator [Bacteroidales bacterium]